MDQLFKKIIQKTKAVQNGQDPIAHTFEGALFKDSGWVFGFDDGVHASEATSTEMKIIDALESSEATKPEPISALTKVMFVGDSYKEGQEDLLGKMIEAMKLKSHEFTRFLFEEKLEEVLDLELNNQAPSLETLNLYRGILKEKPMVVVSLGATSTNILLGKREKLSGIHGQFFLKSIDLDGESFEYLLFPIFHPEFLLINPNMKRTAWIDLQKVMERVGKI